MQRVISATLFLVLAFSPVYAQMRGGRAAGGGFRSAPFVGAFRGAPTAGAFRSAPATSFRAAAPHFSGVTRSQAPGRHWGSGFGYGYGVGVHPYHHRPYYYGYYGYPYYSYAYGYPYAYLDAYPFDSNVYGSYYSNNDADYYAQQQLNAEIGSLNEQMQQLREENDSLRDYVSRDNPAPTQGPDRRIPQSLQQPMTSDTTPAPATVLFFRDGHSVEVHNYAIVGKTLWALSQNRSQKYPLTDLDLEKTVQENEKRGVEFTAPSPD